MRRKWPGRAFSKKFLIWAVCELGIHILGIIWFRYWYQICSASIGRSVRYFSHGSLYKNGFPILLEITSQHVNFLRWLVRIDSSMRYFFNYCVHKSVVHHQIWVPQKSEGSTILRVKIFASNMICRHVHVT